MGPVSYESSNNRAKLIPFGEYLFRKLVQSGSKSIFGVPGDYNLPLLEHLYDDSVKDIGCRWIACCNELNAAYAADGYSRYTNKLASLVTTYGVGELSAINGVAGSTAENVKVLHIVGVVKSDAPECNYHHLIPQLQFSNFVGPNRKICYDMVKDRIACSAEYLENIETAPEQVEKVIRDIYKYSKPGYLFVPVDFADKLVDTDLLNNEINLYNSIEGTSSETLNSVVDHALQWIYQSQTPAILGDANVDRFGLTSRLNQFIERTQMINFTTVMGKSIIDETNKLYMGLYAGKNCTDLVRSKFLSCDLILHFGVEKNEVNYCAQGFPYGPQAKVIEFHQSYIRFFDTLIGEEQVLKDVNFVDVLTALHQRIDVDKLNLQYNKAIFTTYDPSQLNLPNEDSDDVTQIYLQKKFPEILAPGDVLVSDTGSFQFGVRDYKLPTQSKFMAQSTWLSIGMGLPAALGVGVGMQDYPRIHIHDHSKVPASYKPKLILGVGDGAAQMTVQELTTMLRYHVNINVFVWNNNGYTIERAIMGENSDYNDIMPWKWTKLFEAFGDFDGKYSNSSLVRTRQELDQKIEDINKGGKSIELVEVKLGVMDYPAQLQMMISNMKNAKK
ncbi:hypothetical protein ZYGR_0AV01770 [Zygosaccharomyces rouxii]|uniref:Pyruvate decarboxylase n=1 Tax=Zygosaccharomyces rouxii TaxID=4956 RepID=A0A1Q3AIQ3_ZYGRO|nr:hypothetical protein ZYGR_0AV01770 [Zygosaccharomyces rouxii]